MPRLPVFLLPFLLAYRTLTTASPATPPSLNTLFDAIYVIGLAQCHHRWNLTFTWAQSHNLTITPLVATSYHSIDLDQPPIPILNVPPDATLTSGQVACTHSHIRVWRHAFHRNYSRILVLEDDVRLRTRLIRNLHTLVSRANIGSRLRNGQPWHYIYLRLYPTVTYTHPSQPTVWHRNLPVAMPAWGTAAYIASNHGIRFLLTRITAYSHPLDIQIHRFQTGQDTQGAQFIALHACKVDKLGNPTPHCPENIRELTLAERGNCHFSATQSGDQRTGSQMPSPLAP